MNSAPKFIAIGENIHCTRIYKVGGKYVKTLETGENVISYLDSGKQMHLPVPDIFVEGEDWKNGKVKHAAVGIWQLLYGDSAAKKAGKSYLQYMARRQENNGASYLDLNVDEFGSDVSERIGAIKEAAAVIQESSGLPLSIDSSNLEILRAGLSACDGNRGKPMVNSVSLERAGAIDVAREAGAVVVAGAGSEESMPSSMEERVQNFQRLVPMLLDAGITLADIFLDPLVFPVSVDPNNGNSVLDTVKELRETYGSDIHFAPGLSNISFGMPNRKLLNQVFAYLCMERGLDGGIVDPLQINGKILSSLDTGSEAFQLAKAVLTAEDQYGMDYISAAREGRI